MRSTSRRLLALAAALGLLGAACGAEDVSQTSPTGAPSDADNSAAVNSPDLDSQDIDEPGDAAASPGSWPHDFEAPLIGGGTIDAGDYEGQDLVLWFWAPW